MALPRSVCGCAPLFLASGTGTETECPEPIGFVLASLELPTKKVSILRTRISIWASCKNSLSLFSLPGQHRLMTTTQRESNHPVTFHLLKSGTGEIKTCGNRSRPGCKTRTLPKFWVFSRFQPRKVPTYPSAHAGHKVRPMAWMRQIHGEWFQATVPTAESVGS